MFCAKSPLLLVTLPLVLTVTAWGQAATEYGLATSNSAAATSKVGTALQRATRPLTQGAATSAVTEKAKSPNSIAVRGSAKMKPKPKNAQPPAQRPTAAAVPTGGNGNALTISVVGGGKSSPGTKPGDKYKRQVQVSFEK